MSTASEAPAAPGVLTSALESCDDAGKEMRRGEGCAPHPRGPAEQELLAQEWRSCLAAAVRQARHARPVGES